MPVPATNVRWRILAMLMGFAALGHFNRISISVAATERIMDDYSISEVQMGYVYSTYLVIYTLCMTPGGWFIDRWGPRRALLGLGIGSSVLVAATGLTSYLPAAWLLIGLLAVRGPLGAVSVPLHPGAARAVSFWFPQRERGLANGLVTGAAVFGIAATYYVFGFLMDRLGWPQAFFLSSAVTLLLALLWAATSADRPHKSSETSAEERERIAAGPPTERADTVGGAARGAAIATLLRNRSFVLLTLSYAALSYFQYLFFYWTQYYFDKVLKLGTADGRLYATITLGAMAVGMLLGGGLLDFSQTHLGGRRGRALVPAIGMVCSGALLLLGISGLPAVGVVTCFALAMGALGASEASFWVTGIELGGSRGGLSAAVLNTVGNAGGLLAPVVTPLFSVYFGWQTGLAIASVICSVGAVCWIWIDPANNPAFPAEGPSHE